MKYLERKTLIPKGIPAECFRIVLKEGDVIDANIVQITPVDVKYKRCGKPNDPETVLYKSDILKIIDAEGKTICCGGGGVIPSGRTDNQVFEGYSIASLVTGISSLLLFATWLGLAAGICGIVFGYMGLKRIDNNPKMYKGKNLARAGLITGIVACALFVLALTSVLAVGA